MALSGFAVACHDASPTQPSTRPPFRQLTSISPTSAAAGSPDLTVVLIGLGFQGGSQAVWLVNNNADLLTTTFVDSTRLTAVVPAALLHDTVNAQVYVLLRDRIEGVTFEQSNAVAFTVTPAPPPPPDDSTVTAVEIAPSAGAIGVGETGLLRAWAKAAKLGRVQPHTPIVWESMDPTIASLAPSNISGEPGVDFWTSLHGVKRGTVTIRAATGGKSADSKITVGEPATSMTLLPSVKVLSATACQSMQIGLELRDASGTLLVGRQAIWTSSNDRVAPVDLQSGWVHAVDSGTVTITATTGLISGGSTITVIGHMPRHGCLCCE